MIIRTYQAADASALAQLFHESVRALGPRAYTSEQTAAWAPQPLDPAAVHARCSDGRLTLVAVNPAGEAVAYGDLQADGHIDHLYRRPGTAGAGVASQIVDRLLDHAVCAGLPKLFVEASELARPLFERKGFVLVRRQDFDLRGVPIHNYAMERTLPEAAGRDPG